VLGEAGARVAVAARDPEAAQAAAAGAGVVAVRADVTDPASVQATLNRVTSELGARRCASQQRGRVLPPPRARGTRRGMADGLGRQRRRRLAMQPDRRRPDAGRGHGVIVNIGSISAMIVNRPQMQPA
jgi:NAD(P)-dependent dehydrogenase (short-subunit alcohol dehydrogenase family)